MQWSRGFWGAEGCRAGSKTLTPPDPRRAGPWRWTRRRPRRRRQCRRRATSTRSPPASGRSTAATGERCAPLFLFRCFFFFFFEWFLFRFSSSNAGVGWSGWFGRASGGERGGSPLIEWGNGVRVSGEIDRIQSLALRCLVQKMVYSSLNQAICYSLLIRPWQHF